MPVDVIMPQMGESIFEGTITKWLKKPGQRVERDEPLFEISTDKVDAEIPAPASGILKEIKVREGETVPIKTVVALIDPDGTTTSAAEPAQAEEKPAEMPAPTEARPEPAPAAHASTAAPQPVSGEDGRRIRSSPLVRRLAREHNIDLTTIRGTGAGGRISKRDILAAIEARATAPAPSAAPAQPEAAPAPLRLEAAVPRERIYFGRYEVQPLSVMRQRIAEHMVLSKRTSPHVYSIDEVDMSRVVEVRNQAKAEFERRFETKLTFMPFFVRACVEGLRAFPALNASLDGTNLVLHREINIGIAVALDWGLIVPVVKHAEEKNFLGLQRAINDLAERARTKKLKPEEVQESTFSITNPGVFGGLMGLPIINQPNAAILGVGAIQKRPVVIHDAIAIRSMVYLTLSYDHRIVDGAIAHQFIGKVKSILENWQENIL
ncbi:MAG: 2-oxo acid dehydrogenase subunit E2 [Acidobacteriia bacterium]|jgi:2-oxoglutarate dehydrogenase E2 component (dihydrolipoamide succinyltransferase)|nr:2-oxo acid dehydrogenase subunit E2 [Terriglobia bacterium]